MTRHPAEWWKSVVAELDQGGDAVELAARHDVNERTLLWWRTELVRRAASPVRGPKPPRLLPVLVKATPKREAAPEIIVECGDVRVRIRGAVRASHFEALVRGLTSAR